MVGRGGERESSQLEINRNHTNGYFVQSEFRPSSVPAGYDAGQKREAGGRRVGGREGVGGCKKDAT